MNKRIGTFTTDQLAVAGLMLLSCLLLLPKNFSGIPATGVDSSWGIAINLAHQNSLVFGKDFVFTYGPLGFLTTRFDHAVGKLPLLLADVFLIVVALYCLRVVWRKTSSLLALATIPYTIYLISLNYEVGFIYYTFYFFLLLHYFFDDRLISLAFACILMVLMFFLKLNTGLISLIVLQLFLAYKLIWNNSSIVLRFLLWPIPLVVLYVVSFLFSIDLKGYLTNGLVIVNYYNDAMAYTDAIQNASRLSYFSFFFVAIVLVILAFILIRNSRTILTNMPTLILVGWLLLSIYIGWKQGFTRYEPIRNLYFFFYSIFFVGTCLLYTHGQLRQDFQRLFHLLLLISPFIMTSSGATYNNYSLPYQDLFLKSPAIREEQYRYFQNDLALDDSTTRLIGKQTVDIFPDEITYAFYNQLTYHPRPAIQSYQAYAESLTHLNYQRYISPDGPAFILAKPSSLDLYRSSFWTDSQAWLGMLQGYDYRYTGSDSLIVLQKKSSLGAFTKQLRASTTFELNKVYQLPSSTTALPFLRAEAHYSLWGKLCRLLVRPPVLYARVWYNDGTTQTIKAILPEIKGGVLLKRVSSLQEMASFFEHKGTQNSTITKIQFLGSPNDFQSTIPITLESLTYNSPVSK